MGLEKIREQNWVHTLPLICFILMFISSVICIPLFLIFLFVIQNYISKLLPYWQVLAVVGALFIFGVPMFFFVCTIAAGIVAGHGGDPWGPF